MEHNVFGFTGYDRQNDQDYDRVSVISRRFNGNGFSREGKHYRGNNVRTDGSERRQFGSPPLLLSPKRLAATMCLRPFGNAGETYARKLMICTGQRKFRVISFTKK